MDSLHLHVDKSKAYSAEVGPSEIFINKEGDAGQMSEPTSDSSPAVLVLHALEEQMDDETIKKFEQRLREGNDLQVDPLYNTWFKFNDHKPPTRDSDLNTNSDQSNPIPEFKSLTISPAFDEVLQYPDPVPRKKSNRSQGASCLPPYLTSDQVIRFLAEKKEKRKKG